jgi:hypothetical protein
MGLDGHTTADLEKFQVDRPKLDIALLPHPRRIGFVPRGNRRATWGSLYDRCEGREGERHSHPLRPRSQKIAGEWWDGKIEQALVLKAEGLPLAEIAAGSEPQKTLWLGNCSGAANASRGRGRLIPSSGDSTQPSFFISSFRRAGPIGASRSISGNRTEPSIRAARRSKTARRGNRSRRSSSHRRAIACSRSGDMPALTFCGAEVEGDGKPYCHHHARKAYLPPKAVDMRLAA